MVNMGQGGGLGGARELVPSKVGQLCVLSFYRLSSRLVCCPLVTVLSSKWFPGKYYFIRVKHIRRWRGEKI